jgi:hypothetical protein
MFQNMYPSFNVSGFGLMGWGGEVLFAILILWSIAWKGLALWKSAREESKVWFIVFLIVNTLGILEILYLYIFSKNPVKLSDKAEKSTVIKDAVEKKEEKPEDK